MVVDTEEMRRSPLGRFAQAQWGEVAVFSDENKAVGQMRIDTTTPLLLCTWEDPEISARWVYGPPSGERAPDAGARVPHIASHAPTPAPACICPTAPIGYRLSSPAVLSSVACRSRPRRYRGAP